MRVACCSAQLHYRIIWIIHNNFWMWKLLLRGINCISSLEFICAKFDLAICSVPHNLVHAHIHARVSAMCSICSWNTHKAHIRPMRKIKPLMPSVGKIFFSSMLDYTRTIFRDGSFWKRLFGPRNQLWFCHEILLISKSIRFGVKSVTSLEENYFDDSRWNNSRGLLTHTKNHVSKMGSRFIDSLESFSWFLHIYLHSWGIKINTL